MLVQEAATGVINLEDDDPDAVKLMLKFLYTGDYPYHNELCTAVEIYVLADKYDLPTLARIVAERFKKDGLGEYELSVFIEAVRTIYLKTSNGSALRKAASRIIHHNAKKLFKTEKSRHWISEVDGLCVDLYFLSMGWESQRKCSDCGVVTDEVICENCGYEN